MNANWSLAQSPVSSIPENCDRFQNKNSDLLQHWFLKSFFTLAHEEYDHAHNKQDSLKETERQGEMVEKDFRIATHFVITLLQI